ncbi:MAG TPA: UDP-N-acetylmuramoyl-L-alanyl-D-glutamate--2,6-diaminopimelate ligase [Solirubrobacteraceae bacterium]|nr:UDP-N-acetylmuramoyl-L-alanyl-D-glutamate--2,6-diaminopimelate ligase [Solirubrobacteraceae bacterium]
MTLRDVLADPGAPAVEVSALAYDNRAVTPGTLFFCVPGFTRDGHDFAPDAVARGAAALVVQRPLGLGVPEILVPDVRAAMAPAAARLYGDPTAALRTVGITGTNGKTTTAFLVRALLEAGGLRTGLLGTVGAIVGGERRDAVRTTPEAIDLQRTFREMLDAGDEAVAMEVSSHALALGRAGAIHWDVAVFTNLTQDHLDFHDDMEDYFDAKRARFTAGRPRVRVVNVDDPGGRRLAAEFPDAVTVALEDPRATLRATDLEPSPACTRFRAGGLRLTVPLPGRFNVLNALCAVAAARALGVGDAAIAAGLESAALAPGRFEPVDEGQPFAVLVDYAHTPDSLGHVLRAARDLAGGRVLAVFGAGGDRDRGKRPLMGEVAARGADVVVVTSDNPRTEAPGAIIADILPGLERTGTARLSGPAAHGGARGFLVEPDRRAAIALAVSLARPGDAVLVAGKGHEDYQIVGTTKHPFSDREEALRALGTA